MTQEQCSKCPKHHYNGDGYCYRYSIKKISVINSCNLLDNTLKGNKMTEEKKNKFIEAILDDDKPWVLITHDNCMDGTGCVLACWVAADSAQIQRPEVVTMQYGKNNTIPDIVGKNVMIADFSFDRDILIKIEQDANTLVVIDHHKTAEEQLSGLDFCHFDMTHSGAVLVYMFLMPLSYKIPTLLQYIEDRDIWKWKLPDTKEVSAYLSLFNPKDYEQLYSILNDPEFVSSSAIAGSAILQHQQMTVNKVTAKEHKLVHWGKYTVPMLNTTTLISEIGNELAQKYPFVIMYFLTDKEIVFSFRSEGDFDLTKLGVPRGHPNAAGRSIEYKDVNLNYLLQCVDVGAYLSEVFNAEIPLELFAELFTQTDEYFSPLDGLRTIAQYDCSQWYSKNYDNLYNKGRGETTGFIVYDDYAYFKDTELPKEDEVTGYPETQGIEEVKEALKDFE